MKGIVVLNHSFDMHIPKLFCRFSLFVVVLRCTGNNFAAGHMNFCIGIPNKYPGAIVALNFCEAQRWMTICAKIGHFSPPEFT